MTGSVKPQDLIGSEVIDPQGEKIGKVGTVYVTDDSGRPEWVTVKTGLFGSKENFVPLGGSHYGDQGLQVSVTKDTVKDAPNIDSDGHLSEEQSVELYRYYGLTDPKSGGQQGADGRTDNADARADMARTDAGAPGTQDPQTDQFAAGAAGTAGAAGAAGAAGYGAKHEADASAPRTDRTDRADAGRETADTGRHAAGTGADGNPETMIRSEERMKVGTETAEAGRARLRKYVVTEEQTVTVPVTHEEVRVEREPISAEEAKRMQGTEIGEQEAEVVLHEERPVVQTESVPVEKVRLSTDTVTEEQSFTGEVRKEQFEMNDPNQQREQR